MVRPAISLGERLSAALCKQCGVAVGVEEEQRLLAAEAKLAMALCPPLGLARMAWRCGAETVGTTRAGCCNELEDRNPGPQHAVALHPACLVCTHQDWRVAFATTELALRICQV